MEEQTVKQEVDSSTIQTEAQQGVSVETPTTVDQGVEEVAPASVEQSAQIPDSPQGQEDSKLLYDDEGVPLQNRALQYKRMLENKEKQQEEILQKLDTIGSAKQTPQYTEDELESFAASTDNEAHRAWALKETRKLREDRTASIVRNELGKFQEQQTVAQTRQSALNQVITRYPDAFLRNQAGQTLGWNEQSPLTQRMGQYLTNPEIKNNPNGLMVAAALAYSDISLGQKVKTQQKTQALQNEVKTLQRKTLVEGAGKGEVVGKTSRQVAIEKSATGKTKDAVDAMKELWKATGRLTE